MSSVIAYDNVFNFAGAVITASSEVAGFEKERAVDNLSYDGWKPSSTGVSWLKVYNAVGQDVDFISIWGSDLFTNSATYRLYGSDDDATYDPITAEITPTDDSTVYFSFTSVNYKYYRIDFNNPATISFIAGVMAGVKMTLPHGVEVGYAPEALVPKVDIKTSVSEKGQLLGASKLSEGIDGGFVLTGISPAWVRSDWKPFVTHAQDIKPFIVVWDDGTYIDEAVACWLEAGKPIPKPTYSDSLYMTISINYMGIE